MGRIQSFGDKETERIYGQKRSRKLPPEIQDRALVKLLMLDASETIDDLRMPPSNKFEKLEGSLAGKYSIRINNQWRILFRITKAGFFEVSIVDYH